MTMPKKKAAHKDKSYLVATFANFPGIEIPLLLIRASNSA